MSTPNPNPPKKRGAKAKSPAAPSLNGQSLPATPTTPSPPQPLAPAAVAPTVSPPPPPAGSPPDPATTPDKSDPGDQTGRNFRYQHAYGVILMVASATGARPYVALWCEHHEDFLAERQDGKYDGYQIKTSRPENGAWRMSDDDLVKSVRRFVALVRKFGDRIGQLHFVTNKEFDHVADDHKDEKRRGRQPLAFLTHMKSCADHTTIRDPFLGAFNDLQAECGCVATELLVTLKRMEFVPGPSRDSFHPVIAHQHLSTVPGCSDLAATELSAWCDRLIAEVCACSSLAVNDPLRHLEPLFDGTGLSASMAAKRLLPATLLVRPTAEVRPFEFTGPPAIDISAARNPNVPRRSWKAATSRITSIF